MDELRWIHISVILTALLQFTAAAIPSTLHVKNEDVLLTCQNVIKGQQNCDSTTWTFTRPRSTTTVELVRLGQIIENSGVSLSVREDCSLVIKKVREGDAGRYDCLQYKYGIKLAPDAPVYLSVVAMAELVKNDVVFVTCSVSPYDRCKHIVTWLYEGKDMRQHNQGVRSKIPCSSSVFFTASDFIYKSKPNSLDCEVTSDNKVELFTLRLQPSAEKPGEDTKTDPKETMMRPADERAAGTGTTSAVSDYPELKARFIVVSAGLSALIITVVTVNIWTRTKGKQRRRDNNVVETVNYENIRASAEDRPTPLSL
ncbi:uncharacterized protein LOC121521840 [Cheilinus undulatus]|uniref:uncharacterized protein LOC121521840 n=1 Tax=Cheilinus undulatus TaxID=241271 RepID=UPI001BD6DB5A|nr:uncharacterized protein LOC121521840 [Cheilinus undulatus]